MFTGRFPDGHRVGRGAANLGRVMAVISNILFLLWGIEPAPEPPPQVLLER